MKRRFTILTAAFALLAILAFPMGMWGQTTYEQLTSIANIDESAQYVLGIDGTGFHYEGTSSWGKTALPSAHTPIYYTLTKANNGNSFTAQAAIDGTTYYLQVPTSNTFSMATSTGTNTDLIIGTTQVSETNYAVANKTTTARHLRINGTSGLRSYAGTTGTMAFFYKVISGSSTTYTVTFNVGEGSFLGNTDFPSTTNQKTAGTYSLPSAEKSGYIFNGWLITGSTNPLSGNYTVESDVAFTADYTKSNIITKTLVVGTNGNCTWTNGEKTLKATVDDVTFDALGSGGNDGKYYSSDNTWRFYTQNTSGLKVSVPEGYKISTVIIKWKTGQPITPSGFTASGTTSPTTYTANSSTQVNEVSFYRNIANVLFQELTVSYEPDTDPAIATSVTINVPADFNTDVYTSLTAGTLTATVMDEGNTPIDGAVVTWSSGNENVAAIDENGTVTLVAAGVTTITAEYNGVEGEYRPSSATYELTVTNSDPNAPGTANNPFTVAQARTFIDGLNGSTSEEVYVSGIISFVHSYNSSYHSITYWISDDGERTNELEVFGGLGLEGAGFESIDDLQAGDQVVVKGHLKKYNTTYEFDSNNELVSIIHNTTPSIIVEEESVTLAYNATSGSIAYSIQNVENAVVSASSNASWLTIGTINATTVALICSANEGTEDRTATVTLSYEGAENVNVTVTQGHHMAPGNWVLTDLADLTASDVFVIVGTDGDTDKSYAMTNDRGTSNAPLAIEVNVVEGTLSGEIADNIQWNISGDAEGYTFYPNGDAEKWLYNIPSNAKCAVGTNDYKTYVLDTDYGYLKHVGTEKYIGIYFGTTPDWRGYALSEGSIQSNIQNQTIAFYKKVVEPETHTLDIAGYGNSAGGYYLIASPVASVTPSTENGFLTDAYDLYEFDQSAANEWVNYEQHGFDIVSGKGYLYASQANTTLTFEGQPYNGNGKIDLVYDENANLKGWNLIGNPFGVTATVDHDYYIMNENGDNFMLTSKETPINAMQGIFIVTESADDNKAVFTTEEPATPGEKLVLNVTHNRGVVDRAMIRFGEGQQMPKAMMSPNNTKIYIEQANNDYAVVRSAAEGEMPVNFKAKENGTYTISVNTENIEMDYLHLIDNMTGTDVDLLQTPSYTFEASTRDYASRFRLVFSAEENGASAGSATFAYFNGNEWVVNNEGDAQLHVIDMTGRIVSTETINGNATVKVNAAPSVYMLRLINGNDIKTQKVIIK
jgi:hypothetical protein